MVAVPAPPHGGAGTASYMARCRRIRPGGR